jgi:hypothetical protein
MFATPYQKSLLGGIECILINDGRMIVRFGDPILSPMNSTTG